MEKKNYQNPAIELMSLTLPECICGSKSSKGEDWTTESEYNLF